MKTLLLSAGAFVLAASLNLTPAAAADQPGTPAGVTQGAAAGAPHWEWQYHYVGHHPRYEGHWVLVQ